MTRRGSRGCSGLNSRCSGLNSREPSAYRAHLADRDSTAALMGLPALAHSDTGPMWVTESSSCVSNRSTPSSRWPTEAEQIGDGDVAVIALAVLRDLCSLAVCSLMVTNSSRRDGIVVVYEAGRSLTARDVTDVTQVPVIAQFEATAGGADTVLTPAC